MRVIKENSVIEDEWELYDALDAPSDESDAIFPYSLWREHQEEIKKRKGRSGVCVEGSDDIDEVAKDLSHFDIVAIDFPAFKDGRGYSHARILREFHGYDGDLRASGDILRDQLFFLQRCGFSSFQLREDKDTGDALKGFNDFSVKYQTAADAAIPVYKQR